MHDTITGPVFQEMLIFGAASIAKEKQSINDLNVFPVPDGDTGTNMSLTMHAAAQELQKRSPATVDLASSITASALLRGARGNSGVILSLLFRGMSKSLKGCVTADGCTFAAAMQEGVSAAYNAVMKPAEGTILTVSRLAADRAMAASAEKNSVEYVIEQAISQGEETLRQTVDMNPVLKKAGVVDAGGKGFLVILKGMLAALRGETMPTLETEHAARDKADFASVGDEDITFAFDTVFIVRRIDDRSIEPFREFLNGIGDSLVIGEDDEAFKVHVHTDTPGVALTEAQRYGTLELAKIENMRTQAEDLAAGRKAQSTDDLEEDGHDHAAPAPQPQAQPAPAASDPRAMANAVQAAITGQQDIPPQSAYEPEQATAAFEPQGSSYADDDEDAEAERVRRYAPKGRLFDDDEDDDEGTQMYDTDDLDYDDEDDGYDKKSKKRGRYADDDETSEDDVMAERIIHLAPPITAIVCALIVALSLVYHFVLA